MSAITHSSKACSVNPLKVSPALGSALAFLGLDGCLPLLHGGQGCTAFALVLMVRHFREAIPLQTTAMSELNAILGGVDNVEQAIGTLHERARPRIIGLCTTALTETRDEDLAGDLRRILPAHPEWSDLSVIHAVTPDFAGGLEAGWSAAVEAVIDALVEPGRRPRIDRRVNLLTGSHLTPADVELLKDVIECFGLSAVVLPDLSASLDGHIPDDHVPTSLGGTDRAAIRTMGASVLTLAVGEQMRAAAALLERRTGVPCRVFERLTGLEAFDAFVSVLAEVSGQAAPMRLRRERSRLVDAMLDSHFFFTGRRVAVAGDPDLLEAACTLLADMDCQLVAAVTTRATPAAGRVPIETVVVGDLDDLEQAAAASGCDLVVTNAHGRELAQRLGATFYRWGFPEFDRLGAGHRLTVGYRGTRELLFEIGNLLMDGETDHLPCERRDREVNHESHVDA